MDTLFPSPRPNHQLGKQALLFHQLLTFFVPFTPLPHLTSMLSGVFPGTLGMGQDKTVWKNLKW